jgi:WD40 repeat protein
MMISNSKRRAARTDWGVGAVEKKPRPMSNKELSLNAAIFGVDDGDDEDEDEDDGVDGDDENNNFQNNNDNDNDDDNDVDDVDDDDDDDDKVPSHQQSTTDNQDIAPSVWHDEDDEDNENNVTTTTANNNNTAPLGRVNISDVARLRKLRKSHDERDVDAATYTKRLREQFRRLQPHSTAWAQVKDADDADDEDPAAALARSAKPLVAPVRDASRVRITRLRDVNAQEVSRSAVQCVDFHHSGAIAMTAGFDKAVRLFRCDGRVNEKLRSVFFDSFPIYSAFFLPTHDEIVVTGRRAHMYSFDLTSGAVTHFAPRLGQRKQKSLENALAAPDGSRIAILGTSGHIDLLSARTKLWQASVKMNGYADAAAFSNDGNRLFTAGSEGVVYEWDLRQLAAINRWRDQNSLRITSLAVSPDDATLAIGNDLGTVSLYDVRRNTTASNASAATDDEQWLLDTEDRRTTAYYECTNLTTEITSIKFSRDGSTMAFASNRRKNALRFLNVPGKCVFSNWPSVRDRVGFVSSFAFSPANDLFAVGDLKGRAQLFRKLD